MLHSTINTGILTLKKVLLLMATFVLTAFFRFLILLFPFRMIARFIGTEGIETDYDISNDSSYKIRTVSWAVIKISAYTPWKSNCMVQALAAQLLLKIFSIPTTLYLGVAKKESNLIAHAWLRSGYMIVTGGENKETFEPINFYGSNVYVK